MRGLTTLFFTFLCLQPCWAIKVFPAYEVGANLGQHKFGNFANTLNHNFGADSSLFIKLGAGTIISNTDPHIFEAQISMGYHFYSEGDEEPGSTNFSSIPFDFVWYYRNTRNMYRFGYGATYRADNSIASNTQGSEVRYQFENAWGYFVRIEKYLARNADVVPSYGIQLTFLDYQERTLNRKFRADSLGFYYRLSGL